MDDCEKLTYNLTSVINIKENKDYITYLFSYNNLQWYLCKEDEIVKCDKKDLDNGEPLLLIYQKIKDLDKIKYIDEFDNSIDFHENDTVDLLVYSSVSKIKEKMNNLDYNMKIGEIYTMLSEKYQLQNRKIIYFCNSRKLDDKLSIKDNKIENDDLIILVEYNFY